MAGPRSSWNGCRARPAGHPAFGSRKRPAAQAFSLPAGTADPLALLAVVRISVTCGLCR